MSRRKKKKDRQPSPLDQIPQSMFDALTQRLDRLTQCWLEKWPDGINPRKMLEQRHGHLIRAYKNGVRAASLYDAMVTEADWLSKNGGVCREAE